MIKPVSTMKIFRQLFSIHQSVYKSSIIRLFSMKSYSALNAPFRLFSDTLSQNSNSDTQNNKNFTNEDERRRSIYVSNLPQNMSQNDLKMLFTSCGEVESILASSSFNTLPKRSGIITFEDDKSAENAIKLGNIDFNGCTIKIQSRLQKPAKRFEVCAKYLPRDITEDEIKQIFGDCGTITRVNFPTDRFGNKIDVCFIGFERLEHAQAAAQKDKLVYKNFPIEVKLLTGENREMGSIYKRRNSLSILVGNIPFHGIEENDIKEFFSQCGKIANIYLARRENGKLLGYGIIEFSSQEEVQKALNLENKTLGGRELKISKKK